MLVEVVQVLAEEVDVSGEVLQSHLNRICAVVLPGHEEVAPHVVVSPDPLVQLVYAPLPHLLHKVLHLRLLLPHGLRTL